MISEIKKRLKEKVPVIVSILSAISYIRHFFKCQSTKYHVRKILKENEQIFLDVGAGDKKGENGWTTIDISKNCDIYWDLRKRLPFPNERVNKIYSSHFLEHLSFKEGQKFLDDCLRVLIPGGSFSICVPNAKIYLETYMKTDAEIDKHKINLIYKPESNRAPKIDYVNFVAYDGGHKYMFDEDNLVQILKTHGFINVKTRSFDSNLDLEIRRYQSIYAEALKGDI